MRYVIVERFEGKVAALHFVTIPGLNEPGFYRAQTSMEGFMAAMRNDLLKHNSIALPDGGIGCRAAPLPGVSYWVKDEDEFFATLHTHFYAMIVAKKPLSFPCEYDVANHHHEGIHSFFAHIGYDRVRKTLTNWPKGRNGRRNKKMMKGLQYLKSLHEVCQFQTTEKGTGVASGMELRRWLQDKCLVVNGLRIGPDDQILYPVTSVVLFPKIKPGKIVARPCCKFFRHMLQFLFQPC